LQAVAARSRLECPLASAGRRQYCVPGGMRYEPLPVRGWDPAAKV